MSDYAPGPASTVAVSSLPAVSGAVTVTSGTVTPSIAPYDASLFGGIRAHHDLAVLERLHDYPGASTAYDPDTYGLDAASGGAATHVPNSGAIALSVPDATVGAKARLRTHDIVRYQPGCVPVVQITACLSSAMPTLKVVRRTSTSGAAVDTPLATIAGYDASKYNRYEIRYAYLGVQTAQFFINGALVHAETFAGALTVPYLKTPHLPLGVAIQNLGAASQVVRIGLNDDNDGLFFEWSTTAPAARSVEYKCASARLVGGSEYPYSAFTRSIATTGVGATLVPLWSMRLGATLNGIASRVQAFPTLVSFFAETNPGALELVLNATLTGATYAATSPSGAVQIDTAATATTAGTSIWRVGHGANATAVYDLRDLFTLVGRKLRRQAFTGTSDTLTFAVQRESNQNFDPRVTCTWRELR